jgi:hypothetical protein
MDDLMKAVDKSELNYECFFFKNDGCVVVTLTPTLTYLIDNPIAVQYHSESEDSRKESEFVVRQYAGLRTNPFTSGDPLRCLDPLGASFYIVDVGAYFEHLSLTLVVA